VIRFGTGVYQGKLLVLKAYTYKIGIYIYKNRDIVKSKIIYGYQNVERN
jgi:hypothetical protein